MRLKSTGSGIIGMNICPNTSFSFDCRGCSLFGRSKRSRLKKKMKEVVYVYEGHDSEDEELCVLGPGSMEAATKLTDVCDDTSGWDCVVINCARKVVTISGPRFLNGRDAADVTGKAIDDVLTGNLLKVVSNIVDLVLSGKSQAKPLNTMYGKTPLTMQAFTMKNDKDTVGTCVVVRPTQYKNADVFKMFDSASDTSSDGSLPPTP